NNIMSSGGLGPTPLTPLQVRILKSGRKVAGKGLPKEDIKQNSKESTSKKSQLNGTLTPTLMESQSIQPSPIVAQPQLGSHKDLIGPPTRGKKRKRDLPLTESPTKKKKESEDL